jgi:hypothetical protein
VNEPAIPLDKIKPTLRIDSPASGAVAGKILIEATAWDRESRIRKVVFKIGKTKIGQDFHPPYQQLWDFSGYSAGVYTLRAIAIDNAGNRRVRKVPVSIADIPVPPPPAAPLEGDAVGGDTVEGEGAITAVGGDFIQVDDLVIYFNAATEIKLNEVAAPTLGLAAQYRGIRDANGLITATDLEIN